MRRGALEARHWCSWEGAGSLNSAIIAEEGATRAHCERAGGGEESGRRSGRSAERVTFHNSVLIQDDNFDTVKGRGGR